MTTMDYTKTLQALRKLKVQTGSLACLGCGHEHNCSTQGCAILRNVVDHMESAQANHDRLEALLASFQSQERAEAGRRAASWMSKN